jgi:Nucleotidyl transferase AbiEii toxin, Type IV TA system
MLHTATVHPATLAILKSIMQQPTFRQFNLVGGTSLSLQIGHRISIDLDLFTHEPFENSILIQNLQKMGDLTILVDNPPFLQTRLNDVKLDFLQFPYPLVREFVEIEGVRLVPIEIIAVMKLLAIARRGVKKDFIDLYFLLEKYELSDLLRLFEIHFPNTDTFHIIKSLTYFDDADADGNPKMLKKVSWQTMKKSITEKVAQYLKNRV